jgi:beta-lactamase regulating signal transducer with metallopeptidase domain
MNAFASWFTPEDLRTLGLALLHFLWQGAALAALAAAALSVSRRASMRYAISVLTLVSMTAAPVITFFLLSPSSAGHATLAPAAFVQTAIPAVAHAIRSAAQRTEAVSNSPALSVTTLTMFVELWFIGVILFSLRTAGGFFLIARLRRRDSHPISAELLLLCREMQQRLGIARAIRYCESLHLDTPAVVGWFRPVVLLPMTAR